MSENNDTSQELTLGMNRVHVGFNPSNDDEISKIKIIAAQAIDFCNDQISKTEDPEARRVFAIAMTEFESAAMFAVKGVAKGLK